MIDLRKHKGKSYNKAQLKIGIPIEMEHTNSRKRARRIAEQHLVEFDGYYTALTVMEKRLKAKKKR